MAEFVGATVVIALARPQGAKVRGLIVNVIERRLILNKGEPGLFNVPFALLTIFLVTWLNTGTRQKSLVVEGHNVLDLDIEPEAPPPAPASASATIPRNEPAVDPAILSYARPPSTGQVSAVSQFNIQPSHPQGASHPPVSPIHNLNIFPLKPHPESMTKSEELSPDASRDGKDVAPGISEPSAILTEPFNALSLNGHINDKGRGNSTTGHPMDISGAENRHSVQGKRNDVAPKTRPKRVRRKNAASKDHRLNGPIQSTSVLQDDLIIASELTPKTALGPGWRETPLTQSRELPSSNLPHSHGNAEAQASMPQLQIPGSRNGKASRRNRKQRQSEFDDQNGWATGEATDIQDMGDFDFEENHKKFDKKKVFEQIRQDDTTADEARLVSFNRLPARPGTYGGKNLHYTENVLDSPTRNVAEHSSNSDLGIDEAKNGRSRITRRTSSRASQQKVLSRKSSAYVVPDRQMSGSGILPDIREDRSHRALYEAPISSNPSLRSHKSSSQRQKPSLRTAASDHRCPYVTPLQMLELEQLAISELDMTEDMMTENAATAIAQTARKIAVVDDEQPSRKKSGRKIYSLAPLIVVLTGNHKTGSRAIAAARQLLNHHAQAVLCVLGLEREVDLLDSVRRQLNIFRKRGGRVVEQSQLMETLKDIHASAGKRLGRHLTTDLIIDALLGMHLSFEDLKMEHQTAYSQLVQWANMCDVTTISIDVPSGVDSSTGATPDISHIARLKAEASRTGVILQGEPGLVVEAHHVLSLGAPKLGLVLGKESVTSFKTHYSWLVADIGLDDTVWKKSGLRGGRGVDFGSEWVTKLEFIPEPGS